MSAPKIPEGYEMMVGREKAPVADELCYCGAKKSEHEGYNGHGHCTRTNCSQFTWYGFLKIKGAK